MRRPGANASISLVLAVTLTVLSVPLLYGSIDAYLSNDTPASEIDPGIFGQIDPEIDPGIFGKVDPEIDPGIFGGMTPDDQPTALEGPLYLFAAMACLGAAFVITKRTLHARSTTSEQVEEHSDSAR